MLQRATGLDATRVLAAIAVVWIHIPASTDLAWASSTSVSRFAVPLFAAISAYGSVASMLARPGEPISAVLGRRLLRIYLPFLAWASIYLALRAIKIGDASMPIAVFLTMGPAQQLWFLPFLMLSSVPLVLLVRAAGSSAAVRSANGWALILAGVGFCVHELVTGNCHPAGHNPADMGGWPTFINLSYQTLPALLWGAGAALILQRGLASLQINSAAAIACLLLAAVFTALGWRAPDGTPTFACLENASGFLVAMAALGAPRQGPLGRALIWLAGWSSISYGIFLSHIVFTQAAALARTRAGWEPSLAFDLATLVFAIIASAATARLLASSRLTRWLVPH